MKIISHRGGGRLAPENSIQSITIGNSLNVYGVEIDARLSSDNKLVVFHDKSLKRLGNSSKKISSLTFSQLQDLKLKSGETIPLLSETLKLSNKLVIEGKDSGWAKALNNEIGGRESGVIRVISFNFNELAKFKKLSPNIECFFISKFNVLRSIKMIKEASLQGIVFHWSLINPYIYQKIKKSNLGINIFSVNNLFMAKFFANAYPEIEITTDYPDKLQILNN